MNTLILRTIAPTLTAIMVLFSIFVLLRGHNEPGGGFIGGLIAVCALAIYGIAFGVETVRRALVLDPVTIAAIGLIFSTIAGLLSLPLDLPFMTGLWTYPVIAGYEIALSSVLVFDVGVYLVVVGAITAIALALEEREDG